MSTFIAERYDGQDFDYETFDTYADAVAYVNDACDDWEKEHGGKADRGWASRDNLYCAKFDEYRWAQVVKDDETEG